MMSESQRDIWCTPMSKAWKQVDTLPKLEAGEVQLWRVDLAGTTGLSDRFSAFLTHPEQLHASRFRVREATDHFIVGRACLRILLASTTGLAPQSIPITTGVHGKPEIPTLDGAAVSFNVAHSKGTILIGLTRKGSVGVDVEYFDRATDILEVAQHNFTEKETATLKAILNSRARRKTFYRYWTRKEAVLKADGRGLIASLSSFDISFESVHQHPVRLSESTEDQGKLYFLSDLDLNDLDLSDLDLSDLGLSDAEEGIQAAAAIALESTEYPVKQFIFPLSRQW